MMKTGDKNMIAKFRSIPSLDRWVSMNCADHEIVIRKHPDGGFIAKVSGAKFSNFPRSWDELIRELEANFAWRADFGKKSC